MFVAEYATLIPIQQFICTWTNYCIWYVLFSIKKEEFIKFQQQENIKNIHNLTALNLIGDLQSIGSDFKWKNVILFICAMFRKLKALKSYKNGRRRRLDFNFKQFFMSITLLC